MSDIFKPCATPPAEIRSNKASPLLEVSAWMHLDPPNLRCQCAVLPANACGLALETMRSEWNSFSQILLMPDAGCWGHQVQICVNLSAGDEVTETKITEVMCICVPEVGWLDL